MTGGIAAGAAGGAAAAFGDGSAQEGKAPADALWSPGTIGAVAPTVGNTSGCFTIAASSSESGSKTVDLAAEPVGCTTGGVGGKPEPGLLGGTAESDGTSAIDAAGGWANGAVVMPGLASVEERFAGFGAAEAAGVGEAGGVTAPPKAAALEGCPVEPPTGNLTDV